MTQLLPPKKEVALALLERSNVDVYLDPRAEGVVVPPQFRKEPRLILKIGLNMPVAIPDLRLDDDSMSCTLSFSRSPFFCVVPWSSVFAMVGDDGRGMVWPDDVPQELAVRVVEEQQKPATAEREPAPAARARGRVVREAEASVGDRPARAKRSRKKKEEARPVLVAVPPPPATEQPSARRAAPEAPASERPVASERPAVPARAQGRARRELPPYLRVVK
jgi:stringent starvation protein B